LRIQIPVKLAAGEYVVEASVRVSEGDTASYFRIVVVSRSTRPAPAVGVESWRGTTLLRQGLSRSVEPIATESSHDRVRRCLM